jgi:hypothetical protein
LEPRIASGTKFAPVLAKGPTISDHSCLLPAREPRQVRPILLN